MESQPSGSSTESPAARSDHPARPPPPPTAPSAIPAHGLTPSRGPDGYYRISPADPRPAPPPPTTQAVPTSIQPGHVVQPTAPSATPSNAMASGGKGILNGGKGGATSASTVMGGQAAGHGISRESGGEPVKAPGNGVQSIKLRLGGVGAGKASTAEMGEKREAMR